MMSTTRATPPALFLNVVLFANTFKCRICGLQLNGSDELVAAGLESEVEVEDVDPWDFHDEDDGPDDWN